MRFTDFYVTWPACTPSRGSILTGRYPQRNGLYDMIRNDVVNWKFQFDEASYAVSPEMTLGLDVREVTIGQALKAAGYATGAGRQVGQRAGAALPARCSAASISSTASPTPASTTTRTSATASPSMFRGNERIKEEGHATDLFQREAQRFVDGTTRTGRSSSTWPSTRRTAPRPSTRTASQAPEKYWRMYGDSGADRKAQYPALITQMDDAIGELFAAAPRPGARRQHAGVLHQRQRRRRARAATGRCAETRASCSRAACACR